MEFLGVFNLASVVYHLRPGQLVSDFRFQISDFRFQILDVRFQISDFISDFTSDCSKCTCALSFGFHRRPPRGAHYASPGALIKKALGAATVRKGSTS